MAVHMLWLFVDPDANTALVEENTGFLDVWLTNHTAWEDAVHKNEPIELVEPESADRSAYWGAEWRFDWSENKTLLISNIEAHIDAYSAWYRLLYHECEHDTAGGRCEWDDVFESGAVPDSIPDPGL